MTITSPVESAAAASITLESILFPSLRLKRDIQSLTPTDNRRIRNGTHSKAIGSGSNSLPKELLKQVIPTSITRNETISAAMYSIRPCPNGCSLSAGLLAIFTPTKLMIDDAASERLFRASAMIAREFISSPITSFVPNNSTLHKIPTQLDKMP